MDPKIGKKILQILGIVGVIFFVGALGYAVYIRFFWGKVSDENRIKAEQYYNSALDNMSDLSYSEALKDLNEALNLNPYDVNIYLAISDIYKIKGRHDLAFQFLTSIEGSVRSDERIQREIGISQYMNGNYDQCVATLRPLFKVDSIQESDVYLFNALLKTGEHEIAIGYLSDLNSCENSHKQSLILIKTLLAGSDYNSAISSLSVCKDTNELASLYTKLLEIKDSEIDESGKVQLALVVISNESLKQGFDKYVISLLEGKEAEFQNYWEPNFILASAYFNTGDLSKALSLAQTAATVNPFRHEPIWLIAKIKSNQGDKNSAISKYELAILLAGDGASVVQEDYINFLIENKLYSTLDTEFVLVAAKYERNEEWKQYGEITLKALDYYLQQNNSSKSKIFMDKLLTFSSDELVEYGLTDMFYLLYIEYLISTGDIPAADAVLTAAEFEKIAFENYALGVIGFAKREDSSAMEYFRDAVDKDTDGYITQKAKEYLKRLGSTVK